MKSRISLKGLLITLGALIIFVGTFRFAMGDVSFPYIFTAGTAAVASQVNDNFSAINTRQTASASTLEGVYYIRTLEAYTVTSPEPDMNFDSACTSDMQGTLTLTSAGGASISGSTRFICDNRQADTGAASGSGTFSVYPDGSGSMSIGGTTTSFQVSKDLNTLILNMGNKVSMGIAIRR